jgi:hypothetical protein
MYSARGTRGQIPQFANWNKAKKEKASTVALKSLYCTSHHFKCPRATSFKQLIAWN